MIHQEDIAAAIRLLEENGYLVAKGLGVTEQDVRRAIEEGNSHTELENRVLLEITRRGGRAWKIRQGKARPPGSKHLLPFGGPPGHTDIVALTRARPWGRCHYLEVKTGGGKLTKAQRFWRAMIQDQGCDHRVVRSLDDIEDIYPEDT